VSARLARFHDPLLRAAAVLAAALLLGACSAPQSRSLLRDWPSAAPDAMLLSAVPFHPQERFQCGPAALATVLQHSGLAATPTELIDEVYLPAREGSLQAEMIASARARGALVYPLRPTLEALIAELRAGNPVLVMQNLGLDWLPRWHYAVVIGYDRVQREFVLRSGTLAERRSDFSTFERTWARSGHWALLVLPADRLPASAEPLPYLRAVLALRESGDDVLGAFAAATRRWPRQPLTWLSLGNAQLGAGDPAAAARSYRRAAQVAAEPESTAADASMAEAAAEATAQATTIERAALHAVAWNNYASALGALGCGGAARAAVACALQAEPEREAFKATAEEVAGLAAGGGSCPPVADCRSAGD